MAQHVTPTIAAIYGSCDDGTILKLSNGSKIELPDIDKLLAIGDAVELSGDTCRITRGGVFVTSVRPLG